MIGDKFIIKRTDRSFEVTNITSDTLTDCLILIRNIYSASALRRIESFSPGETKIFSMHDFWLDNHNIDKRFYAKVYSNHELVYEKIINDKTRCFVLLSNKEFEAITEHLIIGLTRYSNVDILHYTIDYRSSLSYNNLINIEFKIKGDSSDRGYMQFSKPSVLLDVIEKGYQNGVFLDSDIQVRSNIEDLFNYVVELEDSPIFNKGFWDFTIANGLKIPGPLLTEALGGLPEQYAPQGITNILIFNKTHRDLFKEWEDACFSESVTAIRHSEFMHDELILNCLLWKKGIIPNQKYLAINVKELEDVEFFYEHSYSEYSDIDLAQYNKGWENQSLMPYDRESIACFHYVKDISVANKINDLIKEKECLYKDPINLTKDNRKEIVVVLAHCDNERKYERLDKCINEIKRQGYPIILSSHINVPDSYYTDLDYIIIDKENPVIDNMNREYAPGGPACTWFRDDSYYHISYTRYNYALAALKLMRSAASLALLNGYDKIHFVNYDYAIKNTGVFPMHSSLLEKSDVVGYHDSIEDTLYINTGLFSTKAKVFIDITANINEPLEFLKYGQPVLEKFIYERYTDKNLIIENSRCIDTIKESCDVNKEATYKGIIDGYGGNFHLYFTKEEETDTYYISNWVNLDSSKKILLTVDDITYSVDTLPYNQKTIIDVTSIIKQDKTIFVNIPDYKFTDKYNKESDTAFCQIYNRSIIKNIESYNLI